MILPWAVHIGDGALGWPWWVGGFASAAALVGLASYRLRQDDIPRLGVFTAVFYFASLQHLDFKPISVHPLLNGLLGVVLGVRSILAITVGIALQAFVSGHGGITTIGVNTAVLGLPALLAVAARSWVGRWPVFWGALIGGGTAAVTVVLNALVLWLGAEGDFLVVAKVGFLWHLPIIALEAVLTAAALRVIANRRGSFPDPPAAGTTPAAG